MQPASGEEYRTIRFLWGGDTAPTKVTVCVDARYEIDDLKVAIIEKCRLSDLIGPSKIDLLKPNDQVPLVPEHNLSERIRSQVNKSATQLTSNAKLLEVFPRQPPDGYLHILVQDPSQSNNKLSKDQRTTQRWHSVGEVIDAVEPDVIAFWHNLWVDRKDPVHQETVRRDANRLVDVDVPEVFNVLRGLPNSFTEGGVLIRDEYKSAQKDLETLRQTVNAVAIVGHPGIGKSSFLFYLLALRLLAQKPTIFQRDANSIYLFFESGVQRLSRDHLSSSVSPSDTWALLDSKQEEKTAPIFLLDRSKLFLVIASSPRPSHWQGVAHYRPPIKIWLMEPFTLEELIQARQLQPFEHSETSIQQFLQEYGPSARDCYAFCSSMPEYWSHICDRVKRITWDTITKALTAQKNLVGFDEGSHKVILIRPSPTDRSSALLNIITKTVAQLLHERDSDARWQNARQLYRTLRADPTSNTTAGELLEPPFHALCMKGTSFRLSLMNLKPGGRTLDTFTNAEANNYQTLTLPPQRLIAFDREHPIEALLADHYYHPAHGTQPSYDSFIFNPEEAKFIIFQVTGGCTHPIKPKGINALIALAKQLGVHEPTLHFVAVVPEGLSVDFTLSKDRKFSLTMLSLEVTEDELYN